MTIAELLPPPIPELPDEPDVESQEIENHEYLVLTNPYERMNYVHLTDDLIQKLDGSDTHRPKPDFVVYLDKSGRPVNWMVQSLWDTLAEKDEDGNVPKRPQSLFVNIDARREEKKKDSDSPENIANLRALFTTDEPLAGTETMNQGTILDGKNVLIVDEISVSGNTLKKANELLKKAFPGATFATHAWMKGSSTNVNKGAIGNPRWYERDSNRFRVVVENLSDDEDGPGQAQRLLADDERIRRGWNWLAKLPSVASPSSVLLHNEINQMANDIKTGQLPYWPSLNRDDEEERIEAFNHVDVTGFDTFRHWMKSRYWPEAQIGEKTTDASGPLSDSEARQLALKNGNKDFDRFPLTESGKEFLNRFTFSHASISMDALKKIIKQKNNVA